MSTHTRHATVWFSLTVACVASMMCVAISAEPTDFGLTLNEDGDVVMVHSLAPDPAAVEVMLRGNLDSLLDTPIRTLVFNIACGSDVMHYPTNVGSRWGWRHVAKEKIEPWATYLPAMRELTAAGLDSVRIAGEWCQDNDRLFVPSYRINDSHYANQPAENPLTGHFYAENSDLEIGESPVPGDTSFARLLNFEHEAVRRYRLGVMLEVIDRYGDLMDGFQIDFMRQPILFPAGHDEAGAELVTEMLREVRAALDTAEVEYGRSMALIVRVPPSLEGCAWSGLDVATWVGESLVDVVIPAAGMTLNHDIDYAAFAQLETSEKPPAIGASVFPRTQFTWPMFEGPDAESYEGTGERKVTLAQLRGAVNNALAAGVEMIEVYNVDMPLDESGKAFVQALAKPMEGDRIYAVTPAYYLDHTDTYEPRKQIPLMLEGNQPADIYLTVGETGLEGHRPAPRLRLGLRGVEIGRQNLRLQLNGDDVFMGILNESVCMPVTGKRSRPSGLHPDVPQVYFQVPLPEDASLKSGLNTLKITFVADDQRALLEIVEVQLGLFDK